MINEIYENLSEEERSEKDKQIKSVDDFWDSVLDDSDDLLSDKFPDSSEEEIAKKIKDSIKGTQLEAYLEVLRTDESELWKLDQDTVRQVSKLLQDELTKQKREAEEADIIPWDDVPDDLVKVAVRLNAEQMESGNKFRIHGFVPGKAVTGRPFFYNNERVYLSSRDMWDLLVKKLKGRVKVYKSYEDVVRGVGGRFIDADKLERRTIEKDGYYAVVTGNAVMVEGALKELGYDDAFAGSKTFVFVRGK